MRLREAERFLEAVAEFSISNYGTRGARYVLGLRDVVNVPRIAIHRRVSDVTPEPTETSREHIGRETSRHGQLLVSAERSCALSAEP
jgi:hypothetical protein